LKPIDQAIAATHGDAAARRALEKRLVDALAGSLSRSAQDYVCRTLRVVGTVLSIKALAALLPVEGTSHIARYALECIPDRKAVETMRNALPKVSNKLKPGIIGSLGRRRDTRSVSAIAKLLGHSDVQVAQAAAQALGLIGTWAAARELGRFAKKAPASMKMPLADARLLCAEQLRADGRKAEAVTLYQELRGDDQSAHVKVAAMRGMATTAAKK
jgi:HEAT repeat protein